MFFHLCNFDIFYTSFPVLSREFSRLSLKLRARSKEVFARLSSPVEGLAFSVQSSAGGSGRFELEYFQKPLECPFCRPKPHQAEQILSTRCIASTPRRLPWFPLRSRPKRDLL